MAVYRKCYYRRRAVNASCIFFTITSNWTIIFSLCLNMMLCGTISCTFNERVRHHHWPVQDEATVPHLMEKSSQHHQQQEETGSKQPMQGCPDCQSGRSVKVETDMLRIEAIKRQILSKLGLRQKPNVTHSLPREVVMETLFRAEDSSDFFSNFYREENFSTTSARTSTSDTMEYDDFYGRTSEIISFAEEGSSINSNRVLEFSVSPDSGEFGQEFKVRTATLWMKADIIGHRTPHKCRTKLYVFKIISEELPDIIQITQQQFQKMTSGSDPVPSYLQESNSGWQKIDLTNIVRTWLSESSKDKLRLLVDCSCCSNWHIHLFNNEVDKRSNVNRPFLVIHTDPNTAKRVRRRALDCSPDSGNQCCKQRFYVSFKAIGWDDWVIAPQGYYANYCRGDCGQHRTPDTYVTYHTHVIEEVRKTHHLSGMQPCCAPLKFSSMSLIYYGYENNIIKRDLPKMVVDECGCP